MKNPEQVFSSEAEQATSLRRQIEQMDAEAISRQTARKSLVPWPVRREMVPEVYNTWHALQHRERSGQAATVEELQALVSLFQRFLDVPKTEGV